jgi:ABC-type multidrug transport system ATPase subunit
MAHSVIEVLEMLARVEGRTVVTVVHQPSWRTFSLFDNLVLLRNGCTVYNGPTKGLELYMSELSVNPPDRANPIDFYFSALQGPEGAEFRAKWVAVAPTGQLAQAKPSKSSRSRRLSSVQDIAMSVETATVTKHMATTLLNQFIVLLHRSSQDYLTDPSKLKANVTVKAIIGAWITVCWNLRSCVGFIDSRVFR